MKILFIEPCQTHFGGYYRAYNISIALSKKHIKVDLLCSSKGPLNFWIKKKQVNDYLTQYELPRIYLHFFLNGRILRGLIATVFGIWGKYDIIHAAACVQLESIIPAFILKLLGKKIVIDWDDYWEGSAIYGEYQLMKDYVAFSELHSPKFFENVIVVSDFLKNLAVKRGGKRVLKIVNGVNHTQFTPQEKITSRLKLKLSPQAKYLITFGNTYSYERTYLLLKTFEEIRSRAPDIKLLMNLDPFELIKKYNLQSKVDFELIKEIVIVGQIDEADLGYYLGASDATLFLMGSTDNERACFPIRVGSYLNGETIIITNDTDSEVSRTLHRYDCALIDKSIKVIATKTVELLNDQSLQKRLKMNTVHAKHELSWDTLIDPLIEYYFMLLTPQKHV